MKRVSAKVFFTVLWRGLCQAFGWFFGLFGYKRDGKFAKCVWGLFATSGVIVMSFFALALVCAGVDVVYDRYYKPHYCDDEYCYHSEYINRDIYFHYTEDGKGYIYNKRTGEKLIKHIAWIAKPLGRDTLVCYSNGWKRGYFSKNTGKVIIEPKYDHAWVFSDGLASVDDNGYIKFIDGTGKVVIDKKMPYIPNMEGYVFHGGYCVVDTDDGELCGLIDKAGSVVLPKEYSSIRPTNDLEMWIVAKGKEKSLLDKDLKTIIPLTECSMWVCEGMVEASLCIEPHAKTAFEFMDSHERLVTVTTDDIDFNSLNDLPKDVVEVAKRLSIHFPTFIRWFHNGVAQVDWQLNPDGRYCQDDDGYGMTDAEEIDIYGLIDTNGNVLVKFRAIKDSSELETMRQEAEEKVKMRA